MRDYEDWLRGYDNPSSGLGLRLFGEIDYQTCDARGRPAIGIARYDGAAVPLRPGQTWFSFRR